MPLQPPPLGPLIRGVVMVHVAEQEARRGPVDNQPDVAADPGRPEALVLRPLDLVQLQPRPGRVHLQVERGGLDRLLLVAGQLRETVGERVGDAELHVLQRKRKSSGETRNPTPRKTSVAGQCFQPAQPRPEVRTLAPHRVEADLQRGECAHQWLLVSAHERLHAFRRRRLRRIVDLLRTRDPSRIACRLTAASGRSIPQANPSQSLNSSASNSCIITYGTNRPASNRAPISRWTSARSSLSTTLAFSANGSVDARARPGHARCPSRGSP